MDRLNIEKNGLEFKNLLSGPAPVGRILNYIVIAGNEGLFHRNGYRYTDLVGQVGYAWTTEFMIGLGIFVLGGQVGDRFQLLLTRDGQKLYDLISTGNKVVFDEGVRDTSIQTVKQQINKCSKDLYAEFYSLFIKSYTFNILKQFLEENGYTYAERTVFMDDLFEEVKTLYDPDPTPYNRDARTTTASNRVPSLLQLCKLFDLLEERDGTLLFNRKAIINSGEEALREYTEEEVKNEVNKVELMLLNVESIEEKYGIDGTVMTEAIIRNSTLQKIFKNNLLISQNCKCVMCGIKNRDLLVGSHIKPAAICNSIEKCDYNNGLLLCCNHDKLFDRYLITFSFLDGQIEISKTISEDDIIKLGLSRDFVLPSELLTNERISYLTEHNIEFHKREEER